eukprot:40875-Prymnesium_polylepis.1
MTSSDHLGAYISKIEAKECNTLQVEHKDQYVGSAFDGTSRLGEALAQTNKWCTEDFKLMLRL